MTITDLFGVAHGIDHPAKFTGTVLDAIRLELDRWPVCTVLDPFAGVGGIHWLGDYGYQTFGVELENEWADAHPRTVQGNALTIGTWTPSPDAIVTSPCYGNRFADTCISTPKWKRTNYTDSLGHPMSPDSAAVIQWGPEYRRFHQAFLDAAHTCLPAGGLLIINMSDHYRNYTRQKVCRWWRQSIIDAGFQWEYGIPVRTPRNRHGENGHRAQCEWLLVATTTSLTTINVGQRRPTPLPGYPRSQVCPAGYPARQLSRVGPFERFPRVGSS